ncbi:MAG: DUF1289 domain-containing protein [Melioribacter sp.]|nr:DUF1289 domain-containing protein [Melioribacter sp.]
METNTRTASPCNNECIMNPATNYCDGCFRTIEEIIHWSVYSDEEKKQVLQKVERRKTSLTRENVN